MTRFLMLSFSLLVAFLLTGNDVSAQNYDSAVGLRLGAPTSVTYKTFISDQAAIEVYGSFRSVRSSWRRFGINGAYQIHNDLGSVDGLQWYYGAGASVFFWSFSDGVGINDGNVSLGISGYLGLEYTFADVPISISADWVPTFFLNGFGNGFGADNGALSVRYTLD